MKEYGAKSSSLLLTFGVYLYIYMCVHAFTETNTHELFCIKKNVITPYTVSTAFNLSQQWDKKNNWQTGCGLIQIRERELSIMSVS